LIYDCSARSGAPTIPEAKAVTPRIGGNWQQGRQAPTAVVVDGIFRALSDPTRRDVLERLGSRPASVSELAAAYDMALPSFVEHLKMLERSGLVRSRKVGRVRTYQLVPEPLKVAEDWLGRQRRLWERRLDQLDSYLMKMKQEECK
jgi:DNA-binding transcriptional ArsR family regulator